MNYIENKSTGTFLSSETLLFLCDIYTSSYIWNPNQSSILFRQCDDFSNLEFYDILVVVDERRFLTVGACLERVCQVTGLLWGGKDPHPQTTYVIGEETKIQRGGSPYPRSHSMLVSEPGLRLLATVSLVHPWHQQWALPPGTLMSPEEGTSCSLGSPQVAVPLL